MPLIIDRLRFSMQSGGFLAWKLRMERSKLVAVENLALAKV